MKKEIKINTSKEKVPKFLDTSIPLEERKRLHKEHISKVMNPIKNFNPEIFAPGCSEELKPFARKRVKPNKILPTFDLLPKEIRIGQMLGMWENKQDLYLIFAHRCNEMQQEIEQLKEKIKQMENK